MSDESEFARLLLMFGEELEQVRVLRMKEMERVRVLRKVKVGTPGHWGMLYAFDEAEKKLLDGLLSWAKRIQAREADDA